MSSMASDRKEKALLSARQNRKFLKFGASDSRGRSSSFGHKLSQIITGKSAAGSMMLGGVAEMDEEMEATYYDDEKIIEASDRDSMSPLNRNLQVSAAPLLNPAGARAGDGERPSSISLSRKTE